jgi:multisubunit Na+/H+ antiporter MnhE subunit
VGVTQMDIRATPVLSDYHRQFAGIGLNPPIFEVDARRKKDVSLLVQALLYSIDPGLEDQ